MNHMLKKPDKNWQAIEIQGEIYSLTAKVFLLEIKGTWRCPRVVRTKEKRAAFIRWVIDY